MKSKNLNRKVLLALLACSMFAGCGTRSLHPKSVAMVTGNSKVPLVVKLRLSDDYRKPKWDRENPFKVSVADHLLLNTTECAQAAFATVLIGELPAGKLPQAVLIPRLTEMNMMIPGGGYSKIVTTMSLEWVLEDPHGKLIWVDTFKAENRGRAPDSPDRDQLERRFDALFGEVFEKSLRAMTTSPEIRKYADNQMSNTGN